MLVLEFAIDDNIIDSYNKDNLWLNRAAQSLAETLRLAASKQLDIEFTELVTGYRLRRGSESSFVDIYLYDSLSSGAGYAVSVAENIEELFKEMKTMLASCTCGSACSKCLKHYRNQYVYGLLDRFSANELLDWGIQGIKVPPINMEKQYDMIMSLSDILKESGFIVSFSDNIYVEHNNKKKSIEVYPAMWKEPHNEGTIFISDAYIKYAKPYAVQKIFDSI